MKTYNVTIVLRDAIGNETHRRVYEDVCEVYSRERPDDLYIGGVTTEIKSFMEKMVDVFDNVRVEVFITHIGHTADAE